MSKKNMVIIPLATLLLLAGCTSQPKREKEYLVKLKKTGEVIVTQASACLSLARSYVTIWQYAEVTGTDFETAATQLQSGDIARLKSNLEQTKLAISELLEEVKSPPSRLEQVYQKLIALHEIYLKIHTLSLSPGDSMEEYNNSINELQNQFTKKQNEFKVALSSLTP